MSAFNCALRGSMLGMSVSPVHSEPSSEYVSCLSQKIGDYQNLAFISDSCNYLLMPTLNAPQASTYSPAPHEHSHPNEYRVFGVLRASYSKLVKQGAPSILCITYHCDARAISEVVCIEHKGFSQGLAAEWWKRRPNIPMPRTVDGVIALSSQLSVPIALRVNNLNRKYPLVVEYIFRTIN